MPRTKRWTEKQLVSAVHNSTSYRQVLNKIGLKPTGGNYAQLTKYINKLQLDTSHFRGHAWNKGLKGLHFYRIPLEDILKENSDFQSYKLKKRLFYSGMKEEKCELCGWAKRTEDGRIPIELDHIDGNRRNNRFDNLRILCPNCHSLQPTHRGKNIRYTRADVGTGIQA